MAFGRGRGSSRSVPSRSPTVVKGITGSNQAASQIGARATTQTINIPAGTPGTVTITLGKSGGPTRSPNPPAKAKA